MKHIKYVPLALLSLFALKFLVLGSTFPEVLAMAVLGAFAAFYERALNDKFQKETVEKLDGVTKRFDAVDSYINKLFENDKALTTSVQKLALPQSVKGVGFGNLR